MLETNFMNKDFSNPLVLASGIRDLTAASLRLAIESGAGGVTIKSISEEPRSGHVNPTMIGTEHFFHNAVGLSNPGIAAAIEEMINFKKTSSAPLIGSIFAGTPDGFEKIAGLINQAPIDFLEVNISCPNVSKEFGTPFAYSTSAVEVITKKVKAASRAPVIIKLSPNAWNIAEMAKAAEAAGADALTAVNTISGMMIEVKSRRPILANKQGGISGPALFPIALKCVYDIYEAVKIPIIGTGGIVSGTDALAMIMVGATLLGVGSAVYYHGMEVFRKITDEMEKIMREEKINSLAEIRGAAHS